MRCELLTSSDLMDKYGKQHDELIGSSPHKLMRLQDLVVDKEEIVISAAQLHVFDGDKWSLSLRRHITAFPLLLMEGSAEYGSFFDIHLSGNMTLTIYENHWDLMNIVDARQGFNEIH